MNRDLFSGSILKVVAILTMLIDHIGFFLLQSTDYGNTLCFPLFGKEIPLYYPMRLIGRMAFPIFSFLIVEGYIHTHNRYRYGLNLFIFALISEIPWNLANGNTLFYRSQNVLFTLFLGYLGIVVISYFRNNHTKRLWYLIGLAFSSVLMRSDYGLWGFSYIILLYVLYRHRFFMNILGCFIAASRSLTAGLSFIFICFYNGQRGFIQGNIGKYLFYLFYPLHLLVLYFIRKYIV